MADFTPECLDSRIGKTKASGNTAKMSNLDQGSFVVIKGRFPAEKLDA
jgi:hypothetical protein